MSWLDCSLEYVLEVGLHRRWPGGAPPFTPDQVRRVLVVRKDNIGDLLCTTPALRALRRAFPTAHLALLVAEHCRAAVDRNPDVNEVLSYTKAKHNPGRLGLVALWDLARVIRDLRSQAFDLAIVMGRPCSRSAAWLAYVSGARWCLGYATPALQPFPFFLNLGCDPGAMASHEVDGCLELLASIGIPAAGRQLTLIPDAGAQAAVRRRLAEVAPQGAGLALVHISARREDNRWPLASFAHAVDELSERLGLSILLSWAPGDASNPLFPGDDGRAVEVAALTRRRPILLPTPTLEELIAAVSLSDFVLSPDGGVMHIAAALGVPQVALFGKTGMVHWAPASQKSAVLQRGQRVDNIPVEDVLVAATEVMARWGRRGAMVGVRSRERSA